MKGYDMKSLLILLVFSTVCALAEGSFTELKKEAEDAWKRTELQTALMKYEEAERSAKTSAERLACILARNKLLRTQKRYVQAAALLKGHLEDEKLEDRELKRLVNTYAAQIMWGGKKSQEEALSLLERAQLLKTDVQNDFYNSYYLAGHIRMAWQQYESVIELMRNIISVKNMHPANLYSAYRLCGSAYEKLGQKDHALEHYKKAAEYGRKVKYKFDYSAADKEIERLSK